VIRRASHEDRLRIAGEIRNEVKAELGEGLRAFVIFASTAKRADGPYSDLELMAITSDDYEESACGFFRDGVYCEVYYVPYLKALKESAKIDYEWPVSADQWHRTLPIYVKESDDCLGHIQTAAWQSLNQERKFIKYARDAMFPVLEDIGSLMNAWEQGIRSDIATNLFHFSRSVVYLVAFVNRHFYPSMRGAWEESKEFEKLPTDYANLIETVHGENDVALDARYMAALELWQNIQDWMREMNINWAQERRFKFPKKKR
jgi:kanamycin nucleotidyltransferase